MKKFKFHLIILFSLFDQLVATAQVNDSTTAINGTPSLYQRTATISLRSQLSGIKVFVDTIFFRVIPTESQLIAEGRHIFRFIHPDSTNWLYPAITETVVIHSSEHLERTVEFPHLYYIASNPYGATVRYHNTIIGTTPLILSAIPDKNLITMSKDGFEEVITVLPTDGNEVNVVLKPLKNFSESRSSIFLRNDQENNSTPIYLSSGTAIASGVAAAYLKIRADRYYHDYRQTGDGGTLKRVRKLDIASGISLAVSEISIFTLCYLFLSR
jgi:hypothetical protein